jgi:hypothetical protein
MILSQPEAYTNSPFWPVAEGAALHRTEQTVEQAFDLADTSGNSGSEGWSRFDGRRSDGWRSDAGGQMPAYQAYPPSGDAEPRPLPKPFRLSVTVRWVMNFTLL